MPIDTPAKDKNYVNIYFRQDDRQMLYKREEYDMLTYLGDLGGLLDIVLLLGVAITSIFVSRLFQAAIVKQAYRVQRYLLDSTPYYESTKTTGHLSTESDSQSEDGPPPPQIMKPAIKLGQQQP